MLLDMSREEKAFMLGAIEIKAEAEKEQERKMKANKPRKRH